MSIWKLKFKAQNHLRLLKKKVKYLTCKSNNISLQDLNAKNCTTLMKADKWNKENLMDMAT